MTARDIRYQAAVVDAGRLLLLHCVPRDEAGFWLLTGGGREAGESAEACVAREVRDEAGVEVEVGPLLYEMPAEPPDETYTRWRTYLCRLVGGEPSLHADPFLHPQLVRIGAAVRASPHCAHPPADAIATPGDAP